MFELAIRLEGVGKMYKIFPTRGANLRDALGFPGRRRYREFWALRGIDFQVERGRRLGIVGRNGAGKSTLLKLITGNITPTEGSLDVRGEVQALIEAGAGFHPEFTGEQNIRAALTLQGVSPSRMRAHVEEIADFTELADFLRQPFRTYSAGMQARLAFATATAVEPEILIVDEMLSAGDAYFASKASERMRALVDSGATLLLVSHSLDHVTMFCDEAIWIDRGRIVRRGSSLEVVKAYQQFTRVLDERRLKAKNRKARQGRVATHQLDNYAETLTARLSFEPDAGTDGVAGVEVDHVRLLRDGTIEEQVAVGDAQDADESHAAYVVLEGSAWSKPIETERGLSRRIEPSGTTGAAVAFNLYTYFEESTYALEVDARGGGRVSVELIRGGAVRARLEEPLTPEWSTLQVAMEPERSQVPAVGAKVSQADYDLPAGGARHARAARQPGDRGERKRVDEPAVSAPAAAATAVQTLQPDGGASTSLRHWPGEGSLAIEEVQLIGPAGEQAVFEVGAPLTVVIPFSARSEGTFPITPVAILYRLDGVLVSTHIGPAFTAELKPDDELSVRLDLNRLNLGDGNYVFSVALYRRLEHLEEAQAYDLVDRSYEFEVVGNDPLDNALFHHPSEWLVP